MNAMTVNPPTETGPQLHMLALPWQQKIKPSVRKKQKYVAQALSYDVFQLYRRNILESTLETLGKQLAGATGVVLPQRIEGAWR